MDKDQNLDVSTEEHKADEEATKEVDVDELRQELATEFGFDPEEDSEKLDKLVAREKAHREKLSVAIKQKINWRAKAQSTSKPQNKEEGKSQPKDSTSFQEEFERRFNEEMEKRDLASLNYPDDIKSEIKDLAKLKGVSVREAAQLPYIQNLVKEAEQKSRIESATPKRSNKGGYAPQIDPAKPLNPSDFDFTTEEGRKAWDDAKEARRRYLSK